MLNPSDSNQRNTLVDLVWLLITLYFLYSIFGFRHFGCQQAPPVAKWDAVQQQDKLEHWEGRPADQKELPPDASPRRDFP